MFEKLDLTCFDPTCPEITTYHEPKTNKSPVELQWNEPNGKKEQLKVEQDVFNQFSIGFDYQSQKIDCLREKVIFK